jgi:hypothetical protein
MTSDVRAVVPLMTHSSGADRELTPYVKPRLEFFPSPCVHADLATTPALAAADQERGTAVIEIAFGESERFLHAQPGSPHDHDESAEAAAVRPVPGGRMTAMISSTLGGSAG